MSGEMVPTSGWLAVSEVPEAVVQQAGSLSSAESTQISGAAQAYEVTLPYGASTSVYRGVVDQLADLVTTGRQRVCGYCQRSLRQHSLTLDSHQVQVFCEHEAEPRSVAQWVRGPVPIAPHTWVLAALWWTGVPLVSLGLLGWLPSALSGVVAKRRRWLAAGVLFLVVLVLSITLTTVGDDSVAETLNTAETIGSIGIVFSWLGAVGYGAFQVIPWVKSRQPR